MILRLGIIVVMLLGAEISSAQEVFESSESMVLDPTLKSVVDSLEAGNPGAAAVALRDILKKKLRTHTSIAPPHISLFANERF